jgi:predicted MFS family arabinose efflux permease
LGLIPSRKNIGILSLTCFVVMAISYVFLTLSIEPRVEPHPEKQAFWSLLRDVPSLLRNDRAFLIYLIAFAFLSLALMGQSFVTAAALVRFQVSGSTVGTFTVVLLASQALGNFGLGTLADRWGRRRVLIFVGVLG